MFKVGDRVRIVNTHGINQNGYKNKYMNGDIIRIQDIDEDGDFNWCTESGYAPITSGEYRCIELVTGQSENSTVTDRLDKIEKLLNEVLVKLEE